MLRIIIATPRTINTRARNQVLDPLAHAPTSKSTPKINVRTPTKNHTVFILFRLEFSEYLGLFHSYVAVVNPLRSHSVFPEINVADEPFSARSDILI
jgi:hypothetical protein